MSPLAFVTPEDSGVSVELPALGALQPNGVGAITLARAALTFPELQDAEGKPLTGKALETAARKFAEGRDGTLDVQNVALVASDVPDINVLARAGFEHDFGRGATQLPGDPVPEAPPTIATVKQADAAAQADATTKEK